MFIFSSTECLGEEGFFFVEEENLRALQQGYEGFIFTLQHNVSLWSRIFCVGQFVLLRN